MKTFEPGMTYEARSICDHNCIFSVTIDSRTAKTVTTLEGKTFRVHTWFDESCEYIFPKGRYSMAPTIRA